MNMRILVAVEYSGLADLLTRELQRAGHDTHKCTGVEELERHVRERGFDRYLIDAEYGGIQRGTAALHELRHQVQPAHAFFITRYEHVRDRARMEGLTCVSLTDFTIKYVIAHLAPSIPSALQREGQTRKS